MNLSRAAKRAFLLIIAVIALVAGLSFSPNTVNAAGEKTISSAGGSISFSYTTQASITNLSSKPAWLSVSSKLNYSSGTVTYTISASANPNCGSRSFDLYFSGTNETYRITQYGLGHSYTVYEKTNPTCSSYGHECFKCARCNSRTQGNQLPMLAHTYTTSRVEPTYTATGSEKKYCKVCGFVASNKTLEKLKCKVVFDPCNGESATSIMMEAKKAIGNLPTKTWNGHTFQGWYTAKSNGTQVKASTVVPAQATYTIYGQWKTNTYKVTYDANGGSGAPGAQTKTFGVDLTLSSTKPKKDGFTFAGWGYYNYSTSASFQPGSVYKTNNSIQLYAVWKRNYTVSYDANGGSGAPRPQTKVEGTALTLSGTKPSRTGYTFLGWDTNSKATSVTYPTGKTNSYTKDAAVKLYAIWKANTYTVSFDSQGGSSVLSRTVTFDSPYGTTNNLLPSPTKTGYLFDGWYTATSGGSYISSSSKVTIADDHKLYAHWKKTYTVSYNIGANASGKIESQMKIHGTDLALRSSTPQKDHYTFLGWDVNNKGLNVVYQKGDVYKENKDITLYAVWKASDVSVTLDYGDGRKEEKTYKYNSQYSNLPQNPVRNGYTFLGWYKGTNGGTLVSDGSLVDNGSAHTLYAHWMDNGVWLNPEGGSYTLNVDFFAPNHKWDYYFIQSKNSTQKSARPTWIPNDPERASDTSKELSFSYESGLNKEQRWTLIYAYEVGTARAMVYKFAQKACYSVKFDILGNLSLEYLKTNPPLLRSLGNNRIASEETLEVGKNMTLPTPSIPGFAFGGWKDKTGSDVYNNIYNKQKSIELEAVWVPYTITFDENGGQWKTGARPATQAWVIIPEGNYIPTREGYTFFGWNTKADGTGEFFFPKDDLTSFRMQMNSNATLYALWNPNELTLDEGGYIYSYEGYLMPGAKTDIKVNIPAENSGYYRLSIPNVIEWDFWGFPSNSSYKVSLVDMLKARISTSDLFYKEGYDEPYYYFGEDRGRFLRIENTTGRPIKVRASIKSDDYSKHVDGDQSAFFEGFYADKNTRRDVGDNIISERVWEAYICKRDLQAFLTMDSYGEHLRQVIKNDKDYAVGYIMRETLPYVHDIMYTFAEYPTACYVADIAIKRIVDFFTVDYQDYWSKSFDEDDYLYKAVMSERKPNAVPVNVTIKIVKEESGEKMTYTTECTECDDDSIREALNKTVELDISKCPQLYKTVKSQGKIKFNYTEYICVDYGVHLTIYPDDKLIVSANGKESIDIFPWRGGTISIRPGVVGTMKVYDTTEGWTDADAAEDILGKKPVSWLDSLHILKDVSASQMIIDKRELKSVDQTDYFMEYGLEAYRIE